MQTKCCFGLKGLLVKSLAVLGVSVMATSCMTTYDAYGNPRQSVDPGMAVAGVAAAGLIGYALGDDDDNYRSYRSNNHYRHSRNYGGYDRCYDGGYSGYGGYGGGYGGYWGGYDDGSCY